MPIGTVKWFNIPNGYGFIVPADGGADVFVHIMEVRASGMMALVEGERVSFELQLVRGKQAATNLARL